MNQPKVSVIIPVYNVEDYIELTLQSLLSQTLEEIEIILIDDGSTDNSQQIIQSYAKKYENIKVILQQNSGPSSARNRGIKQANGDFIVFVDSDDLLPENSIELRYNAAIQQNADIVIGGTYKFNSKRKWPMVKHFLGEGEKHVVTDSDILWTVGPCNKIYKTEIIKKLKFPEHIKYAEDQVFVIQAYLNAKKIYSINETVYYYRMREVSGNDSLTQQIYTDSANVLRQIYDVWTTTCCRINQYTENDFFRISIKKNYLNRLAEADIWPALKAAIIGKNKEVQKNALQYAINIVESVEPRVLVEQTKFKWIMSKGIIDKYLFIDKSNRNLVLKLLTTLFSKMDAESLYHYEREQKYFVTYMQKAVKKQSILPIYEYLTHRRLKKIQKSLKPANLRKSFNKRLVKFCSEDIFKISKNLPVKKELVILATNRSTELEGNLKAVHDELSKHHQIQPLIYLKQNKVSNVELIKMYYHFARAKYIILDDYYRQLYGYEFNKDTEIIQLWHACGAFKKFGFSAIGQGESNTFNFEKRAHQHYTNVITSAKEINKYYAEAFNIPENKVLNLGVPRTDSMLNADYREYIRLKLEKDYPEIKGKKVITYAPTFRGNPKERKNFNCELDYTHLINELGDSYVLILKLHPVVNEESVQIPEQYRDKILNLTSYKDINDLLIVTDILITDYSSVIFEYSLLERPTILFAYDLEDYIDERNFYYDYQELVPGPIAKTNEELIQLIKNNRFDFNKIRNFKNKFFDYTDGESTKRVVEYIISHTH